MEKDVPVKSLKKALDLLSILLFEDPFEEGFSVKALAEKSGLPANSVHNLLKTMAVCGYVEKNGEGRYTYGNVCRRIAFRNYQSGDGFREKVIEVMRRTIARINEAMVFCVLENNVWTSLVKAEPAGRIVKVDMEQVERFYLYETATGRILYSFSLCLEHDTESFPSPCRFSTAKINCWAPSVSIVCHRAAPTNGTASCSKISNWRQRKSPESETTDSYPSRSIPMTKSSM